MVCLQHFSFILPKYACYNAVYLCRWNLQTGIGKGVGLASSLYPTSIFLVPLFVLCLVKGSRKLVVVLVTGWDERTRSVVLENVLGYREPEWFMFCVRSVLQGGNQNQQWARYLLFSMLSEERKINDKLWYIHLIEYGLRCLMTWKHIFLKSECISGFAGGYH